MSYFLYTGKIPALCLSFSLKILKLFHYIYRKKFGIGVIVQDSLYSSYTEILTMPNLYILQKLYMCNIRCKSLLSVLKFQIKISIKISVFMLKIRLTKLFPASNLFLYKYHVNILLFQELLFLEYNYLKILSLKMTNTLLNFKYHHKSNLQSDWPTFFTQSGINRSCDVVVEQNYVRKVLIFSCNRAAEDQPISLFWFSRKLAHLFC